VTSYHFTCVHSAARIEVNNVLRPWPQKALGNIPLIWLTPSRSALGSWLGMAQERQTLVTCNRMEVCFQVVEEDEDKIGWWGDLKRDPRFEQLLPMARRLDGARGAKPGLWQVAATDLRVVRV
jgi:hypothetical protein